MDCKSSGSLIYYASFLIFLQGQLSPAFPVPIKGEALCQAKKLIETLKHEATELRNICKAHYGQTENSKPADVPDATISGVNFTEKLQDIFFKNKLFYLHILQVEIYQKELLSDPEPVHNLLNNIKTRLMSFSGTIQGFLKNNSIVLTTPDPPQLSHSDLYSKKAYVWGVVVSLKDWSEQVGEVVKEAKKHCDRKMGI